ncbi:MAG: hypothetical protein V3U73_00040, partial [bacterium]
MFDVQIAESGDILLSGRFDASQVEKANAVFDQISQSCVVNFTDLERNGRMVRELTHDRAIDISPSWSGDGRWLLWSSDRTGIPNLF